MRGTSKAMRPALRWGVLLVAIASSLPVVARAEDSVLEREAQARFEEGVARVKAGDIEGARISFAQAYAVVHKSTILWNLALAEEKTGHALDALTHFRELARGAPSGGDDRGNAEKHIGALMAQTGHLDVAAPAGARLFVDGTATATAPFPDPFDVSVGKHHLQVRSSQSSREADVDVGAGQLLHVDLMPTPPVPATAPAPGTQGGSPTSTSSATGTGGESRNKPSAERAVTVVIVATAAAASLALGAYFTIQAQSDESTSGAFREQYGKSACYRVTSSLCSQWNDALQAQSRDATLSDVFWVAGGVLAVGAAATWFFWPNDAKRAGEPSSDGPSRSLSATLRWMPTLGRGGGGLSVTGRF